MLSSSELMAMVDHTLLKPEATSQQIDRLCGEAIEFKAIAVCVNGYWTARASRNTAGSDVLVCSVVGFPLGAMSPQAVAEEAAVAAADGAREIDMVLPVGLLKEGDVPAVNEYIGSVRASLGPDLTLKVILETALLDDDEIRKSCEVAVEAGADFVKTSTGFNPAGGATAEAVRLMRETVGESIGVKASGGIRTLDDVLTMVEAGASRLGMSAAIQIANELPN